ncbi:MAG TPA: molecular chaperone DnaJ [Acidimicrobiales bacterium]|jgi:molecular chaperone DnaJ|nr:molecular chaperone DnaJ [Acidimicrobiales bacterium]
MADFYQLLGVRRDASADELKRAYRRLARELHPDTNPDPTAEERFKEITRAYEVLADADLRARYDRFGEAGVSGAAASTSGMGDMFGGGLGDLFESFFGGTPFGGGGRPMGPPRGQDLEATAELAFEQAVFGTTLPVSLRTAVRCETCGGNGAEPGTHPVTCAQCAGTGQVRRVRQSMLGQMVTSAPCNRCGGYGEVVVTPCSTCAGEGRVIEERTLNVDVPAGVDDRATLRLTGRGAAGPRGGPTGDLFVHLHVRPHERFTRDGVDLVAPVSVSFAQAALGTRFTLPTLDGDEELKIPAGTKSGRVITFKGRGVPVLQGRGRGDLRVHVTVETPDDLDAEQEELLRRLAELRGEPVEPPAKGLRARIKSALS